MTDAEKKAFLDSYRSGMSAIQLKQLFPHASLSTMAANNSPLSSPQKKNKTRLRANLGAGKGIHEDNIKRKLQRPKPERHKTATLGATIQGKAKSIRRIIVRFTGYRVRPLDPDNFAGGTKDLLDGLRHARLIPGDEPWRIKLETRQVKVKSRSEERTEIQIETD